MRPGGSRDAGGVTWCTGCPRSGRFRTRRWIPVRSRSTTWEASASPVGLGRGRAVSNRRVRFAGAFLSTLALLLQGCYETLPLQQGPPPTSVTVRLALNDKGRVAVADELGSAVDQLEGVVTAQNSDSYTIAVSQVYQLN